MEHTGQSTLCYFTERKTSKRWEPSPWSSSTVAGDTSPAWTLLMYGDCDASTEVTVTYLQQQPCATLLAEKSMLFIVMHKAFSHSLSCRVSASQHRWLKWTCEISGIQWRLWELSAPPVDRRPAGENHTDVELFRNCSNNSPCPVKICLKSFSCDRYNVKTFTFNTRPGWNASHNSEISLHFYRCRT